MAINAAARAAVADTIKMIISRSNRSDRAPMGYCMTSTPPTVTARNTEMSDASRPIALP